MGPNDADEVVNSEDTDKTAPKGAVLSGSVLLALTSLYYLRHVSCELSQPIGKTEFSSTAKNRTNSVSQVIKRSEF